MEAVFDPSQLLEVGAKALELLELPRPPNAEVPDKELRSEPPKKLASGKPPNELGELFSKALLLSRGKGKGNEGAVAAGLALSVGELELLGWL